MGLESLEHTDPLGWYRGSMFPRAWLVQIVRTGQDLEVLINVIKSRGWICCGRNEGVMVAGSNLAAPTIIQEARHSAGFFVP